jgi:hypothetical protein
VLRRVYGNDCGGGGGGVLTSDARAALQLLERVKAYTDRRDRVASMEADIRPALEEYKVKCEALRRRRENEEKRVEANVDAGYALALLLRTFPLSRCRCTLCTAGAASVAALTARLEIRYCSASCATSACTK